MHLRGAGEAPSRCAAPPILPLRCRSVTVARQVPASFQTGRWNLPVLTILNAVLGLPDFHGHDLARHKPFCRAVARGTCRARICGAGDASFYGAAKGIPPPGSRAAASALFRHSCRSTLEQRKTSREKTAGPFESVIAGIELQCGSDCNWGTLNVSNGPPKSSPWRSGWALNWHTR